MKTCKDCRHYVAHYICTDYHGYREIEGHCSARRQGATLIIKKPCPKFTLRDYCEEREEKCERVQKIVRHINNQLQKLVEYIEKTD